MSWKASQHRQIETDKASDMALMTFRSPTQGSVIMFGDHAKQLLAALDLPESGEIMTAQLPALMARLQQVIAADKSANPIIWPEDLNAEEDKDAPVVVQLSQRAAPMLQLMERCLSATETIRWPA
jgi:hypothetical protein